DLLPLAAGELDPVLEALADHLVVPGGQLRDHVVRKAAPGRLLEACVLIARPDTTDGDVVGGGQIVTNEILEDDADIAAQGFQVIVAQVASIKQDEALVR